MITKIINFFFNLFNRSKHQVFDVFTPSTEAGLTFVERPQAKKDFVNSLKTHGRQLVIFGHSGSGKTTLVKNILDSVKQKYIVTSCESSTTIEELILSAFDKLNPYYIDEKGSKLSAKISSELKTSYLGIESKISGEGAVETSNKLKRVVPIQLTPQRLSEFFGAINCIWVIEDFHKVGEEQRKRLADIMKIFKDTSKASPTKIIAIGAVGSPREIIEFDDNLKNRVAEIEVPLMNEAEIGELIKKGENLMKVEFEDIVKKRIVSLSNGLASVCHHLCLNICTNNDITETSRKKIIFSSIDLDNAVQKYVNEQSDSFKSMYDKAVKVQRQGKFNNGELIIKAMLNINKEEVSYSDLLTEIKRLQPDYPQGNLTTYLSTLTSPERDEILRYDEDANKYSFSNPFLKVYAMMTLLPAKNVNQIRISGNKNVVVNSTISAGGDVRLGDIVIDNNVRIDKQVNISENKGDVSFD